MSETTQDDDRREEFATGDRHEDIDVEEAREAIVRAYQALEYGWPRGNVEARVYSAWDALGGEFPELQERAGPPTCTRPGCESDAVALFDNGFFQEERCDEHSSDHLTVVRKFA